MKRTGFFTASLYMRMKTALLLPLALLSGCVLAEYDRRPARIVQRSSSREYTGHGPNCPDLIAASSMNYDNRKVGPLREIAARPLLTVHEQIHLIDVTMDSMSYDDSRAAVLEALAQNTDLAPDARMHLARKIRELSTGADRVTAALMKNPPKPAPPPPPPDPREAANDGTNTALGLTVTTQGRVVVVAVDENGPAAEAGLQVGDVMVAINDWEISDFKSWKNGVKSEIVARKAQDLWLKAERGGARIALNVVLKK